MTFVRSSFVALGVAVLLSVWGCSASPSQAPAPTGTIWPDGKGITLVLRDPSSPGTKFILEKVLGGTFDEEKAVLSDPGRRNAVPVVFAESDEEVMRIVGGNAGAIGVIDVYNITGGVKVVKIDDKQPFDPGYILKGR